MGIIDNLINTFNSKENNSSLGVKEGYAYNCNFVYESDDDILGNEHYELGFEEGVNKAKINQCDENLFNKL